MHPTSQNFQPFMFPTRATTPLGCYYPLPVAPINYQLPFLQNWAATPLEWSVTDPIWRQLMANQSALIKAAPSVAGFNSVYTETAYQREHERLYGKRHGLLREELVSNDQFNREKLLKREDHMIKKEDYFMVKDESSKGDSCQYLGVKTEYKVEEESLCFEEASLPEKKGLYKESPWDEDKFSENPSIEQVPVQATQNQDMKTQIKEMVVFMMEHFGRIREEDLLKQKLKYQHSPILSELFEILYAKYQCTFKTRAEVIKYITRKAFSTIKNNSKKDSEGNSKETCKMLCKRYFQVSSEEIQNTGIDIENRERFLQLLFPYQKNSKNKLQDMELISKLMASKEFYGDYCKYVEGLDPILEADNNRKLSKFITFILSCIAKGQLKNIMTYKRVPWLKTWLDNTKIVAKELAFSIQWKGQQNPKKAKTEENQSTNGAH